MPYFNEEGKEFSLEQDDCVTCKRENKCSCIGYKGKFIRLFEDKNIKPYGEIVVGCDNKIGKELSHGNLFRRKI